MHSSIDWLKWKKITYWGNVNANDYDVEALHDPHNHHPQNPEVPEDWMGGPLVPGYPYYDADEMMMMYYD